MHGSYKLISKTQVCYKTDNVPTRACPIMKYGKAEIAKKVLQKGPEVKKKFPKSITVKKKQVPAEAGFKPSISGYVNIELYSLGQISTSTSGHI